jgi:diguanylate cyclase (GGDEF)-like protein
MGRSGQTMDHVRRWVDHAMVGSALALTAWPWLLADAVRGAAAGGDALAGVVGVAIAVATVLCLTIAVIITTEHWRLLHYVPLSAAFLTVVGQQLALGTLETGVIWLLIAVSATVLTRQFLGARTNEGLLRDLSRQRAQLARQAYRDPLTELGNRTLFLRHAGDALADADDTSTAVIMFDLDGFKHVNDTWGHATGDELLRTAAERLQKNVRTNDTVARLGGDEFVVLLPRLVDDQIADTVANRILHDLSQPLVVGQTVLTIPASAGIGLARGTGTDVDTVLREADLALYQAKAEGKGVARRFDPELFAVAEQRRREEEELRNALAEEQFEVHYQPIVDLDGEHTVGVEALVRWNHPTRGLLAPAAFLDLAESLGMLPKLGGWVLLQACRQAAEWQQQRADFEVNVNLSASQLSNPRLVDEVREVLEVTGLPPELLVLELTESVALTDLIESARILRALKTLGIRLALDDFGTGFSSLSHLGALPVDVVKIDRSFVAAMAESTGATVAEAVLQIARTFNLAPVAEGVEDAEQASRLRDLDCAQAQGYHFARPMPAAELTALLTRQSEAADLSA